MGHGQAYYEKVVKPQLHSFMGSVFEEMCRYYTLEQGITGAYGSFLTQTGTWWGTEQISDENGKRHTLTADIDVVGISSVDKTAVVGECKFKNEKLGKEVYETLVRRSKLLSGNYHITRFLLFSLSGFTKWFDAENPANVIKVTVEDLYRQ